ncbi:MAG: hypothetical protein ABL997_20710, partial [Planctomycetota bacterium]
GGRSTQALALPSDALLLLVPSLSEPNQTDVVVARVCEWHDQFVGMERYGLDGDMFRLRQRCEWRLRAGAAGLHSDPGCAMVVDDLDGDGVADFALPGLAKLPSIGVLFVSGRTLQPLATAPLQAAQGATGLWVPACPKAAAHFVAMGSLRLDGSGFALWAIEPGR